jgi:hypothetical protein
MFPQIPSTFHHHDLYASRPPRQACPLISQQTYHAADLPRCSQLPQNGSLRLSKQMLVRNETATRIRETRITSRLYLASGYADTRPFLTFLNVTLPRDVDVKRVSPLHSVSCWHPVVLSAKRIERGVCAWHNAVLFTEEADLCLRS